MQIVWIGQTLNELQFDLKSKPLLLLRFCMNWKRFKEIVFYSQLIDSVQNNENLIWTNLNCIKDSIHRLMKIYI